MGIRGQIVAAATAAVGPRGTGVFTRQLAQAGKLGRRTAERVALRAPRSGVVSARYRGMRIDVDLHDNVQHELFYLGQYENDLVHFLLAQLTPDDTFIDVGAHIGVFSLPLARSLHSGAVISFEPAPDAAELLRRNACRNRLGSLRVVETALGDAPSVGVLRTSTQWSPSDLSVRSLHGDGSIVGQVPVVRFDDWAAQTDLNRVDAVKIDVEGGELAVLRGMQRSLERFRPRLVVVEVVPEHLARAGVAIEALDSFINDVGYVPTNAAIGEIAAGRRCRFWPNVVLAASD